MARLAVPEGTTTPVYAGMRNGEMFTREKPVAYRVDHTGPHVDWSGRKSVLGAEVEPRYEFDGELYCKNVPENEFWVCLGYSPKPVTDWDKARFDFLHGMIMKYGVINSACFAGRWYYKRKMKKWRS